MKSFRWKVWRYGKRASVLVITIIAAVLLVGGGALAFFLNGGFGPASSSNSVNLSKGLVGWWKMDGNTKDSSPYGDDGALSGISVVQGPIMTTSSNTSSLAATWPVATTAGNTLVAVITFNNTPTSPAVAPSGWTLRSGAANAWGTQVYEIVNSASRSGAESFTWGNSEDATLWLFELSGVDNTAPDDVTSSYSGSGTGVKTLGPVTAGANASMAFAIADSNDGCATSWSMTSTGWRVSDGYRAHLGYLSINGGQSLQAVFSAGCTWQGAIVTFNTPSANRPSLTTDRKGATNSAYKTGNKQDIRFNATPSLDTSYITVNAWVYYTASNASQTAVSRYTSSPVTGDWILGTGSNGTLSFYISGYGSAGGGGYSWNTWMMLTGIYDGTNITFYLNGSKLATVAASQTGALPSGLDALTIGGRSDGSYDYQHGGVDDVRIYNRALSDSEVQALYKTYNDPLGIGQGEKSLVGWWKMNGNYKDSTPYNTVCTPQYFTPGYTTDQHGTANGAFSIGTAKLGFDCGQPTALCTSNVTVSAWVNPSSYNSSGNGIESYGGVVQFYFDSSGFLRFQVHDSSNVSHTFISPSSYATGTWYHVATTYDGSTVNMYVNGSNVYSTSYTGGIGTNHCTDSGNDFLLSDYGSDSTTKGFLGAIDDIRYYSRALSATEITNLYKSYDSQISLGGDGQSTTTSINLQKGLVGYWPMNGNIKDATPYSDNGTVNGATLITDRKGRANSAYNFNGSSNQITFTGMPATIGAQVFSVSLWVYPLNVTSGSNIISRYNFSSPQPGDWDIGMAQISSHAFNFAFRQTSGSTYLMYTDSIYNVNQWYFITLTCDGTNIKTYVDGVDVGDTTLSASIPGISEPLTIGSSSNNTGYWDGSVDDVRIYNRVLNTSEVRALYNEYQ